MTKLRRTNDECMTVGAPMTVLRISCCGASDTDSQGDFVNACSVERAEGPQCGDEAEMLNAC